MSLKEIEPIEKISGSIADPVDYYYDTHQTEEDLMGMADAQLGLMLYLIGLLRWLYREEAWYIAGNLNIYRTGQRHESPIVPDIAVFKNVDLTSAQRLRLHSWKMLLPGRPAPSVTFEIASEKTWKHDIGLGKPEENKILLFAALGVAEYFAYDPNDPPYWPKRERIKTALGHLKGWRYYEGQVEKIEPNEQGWLWSQELDSWLVPDGGMLRLYDLNGSKRLNEAEEAQRESAQARSEADQIRAKLRARGIDLDNL